MPKAEAKSKKDAKPKKEVKAKKEKKKKDPNAPKRAMSAYMFFCGEHREKIKSENPDMKVTEVTTELGKAWKELSDSEKKKFFDMAEKDKARASKEMDAYKAAGGGGKDDAPKKKKAAPKKKKADSEDEEEPESEGGSDDDGGDDDEDDE